MKVKTLIKKLQEMEDQMEVEDTEIKFSYYQDGDYTMEVPFALTDEIAEVGVTGDKVSGIFLQLHVPQKAPSKYVNQQLATLFVRFSELNHAMQEAETQKSNDELRARQKSDAKGLDSGVVKLIEEAKRDILMAIADLGSKK